MKRYRFILLDADGTLFDFDSAEREAFSRTMARLGVSGDYERYHEINGSLWRRHDAGELSQRELSLERWRIFFGGAIDAFTANEAYKAELGNCAPLIPGADELCRSLVGGGYRLYIVTNGLREVYYRRLVASGLSPYIEGSFVSEELGHSKPRRGFYEAVARGIPDFDPELAVAVGDSVVTDIAGALGFGLDAILFSPEGRLYPGVPTATTLGEVFEFIDNDTEN